MASRTLWLFGGFIVVLLLASVPGVSAEATVIDLPEAVEAMEQFLAFRDSVADTPEGGAAVFVLAMLLFESDQELGTHALTVALDRSQLREATPGYRGFEPGGSAQAFITRSLLPRPSLARSYLLETSAANAYAEPEDRRVAMSRNRYSVLTEDRVKVFVECSGASSPRPLTLQKNNRGVWKAYEYSSLFVGIQPPEERIDDSL